MSLRREPVRSATDVISYAPHATSGRKLFRRAMFCLAGMGVLVAGMMFGPRLRNNLLLLNLQRYCFSATAPADKIVYEDDPGEGAKLMKVDQQYFRGRGDSPTVWFCAAWDRFYAALSPPGRQPMATLFIGELRRAGGPSRLVVVEGAQGSGSDAIIIDATVIEPGSLVRPPRLCRTLFTTTSLRRPGHIFSGQVDPSDRAMVRIRLESAKTHSELQVMLNETNDGVRITSSSLPVTRPVAPAALSPPWSSPR